MTETLEVTSASENVFKDLGFADAEVLKVKARLAAELIRIMRERRLSVRATAKLAGVDPSDIARICNVDLDRFTIDRLLRTVHRLDDRVRVQVTQAGEGEAA
ncbi:MAG: helix-turn-helix transcriptional regulator [Dongiaceae bacterium]